MSAVCIWRSSLVCRVSFVEVILSLVLIQHLVDSERREDTGWNKRVTLKLLDRK